MRMEWDCFITGKGTKREKWTPFLLVQRVVFVLVILSGSHGFYFDCQPVKSAGNCSCEYVDAAWEINCPKGFFHIPPISLKVTPWRDSPDDASLIVSCDMNNHDFPWGIVTGANFSSKANDFKIAKLEVNWCTPDPQGWAGFFEHFDLSVLAIRRVVYKSYRKLKQFPPHYFSPFVNLESLSISRNGFNVLPNVEMLKKLKSLDAKFNDLTQINGQMFAQNLLLEVLEIKNNSISDIEAGSLPGSLTYLDLSDNELNTISNDTLGNLSNLTTLLLHNNPLNELSQNAFGNTTSLEKLSLSLNMNKLVLKDLLKLNRLRIIGSSGVSAQNNSKLSLSLLRLKSLEMLRFYNLELFEFPVIKNCSRLRDINIEGTKIVQLKYSDFAGLKNLEKLSLRRNRIDKVEDLPLPSLDTLDLSHNLLKFINDSTLKHLTKLTRLSVSHNQLESLETEAFKYLASLEKIDFSYNFINLSRDSGNNYYHQSPFRHNSQLSVINLQRNRITEIFEDWRISRFKLRILNLAQNNITSLTAQQLNFISQDISVDLSHNMITTIDMDHAFIYLQDSGKVQINLNYNPFHCDCQAFELRNLSLKSYKIVLSQLQCASPDPLKGKYLIRVNPTELTCSFEAGCYKPCICTVTPELRTVTVNCSNQSLSSSKDLPEIVETRGKYRTWKWELDFSNNNLTCMTSSYINELPKQIKFIDLKRNNIGSLEFLEKVNRSMLEYLGLEQNPFLCENCQSFHFQRTTHSKLIKDPEKISCMEKLDSSGRRERQSILKYRDISSVCNEVAMSNLTISVLAVLIAMILIIVAIIIYLRHGWALKAYFYYRGISFCNRFNEAEEAEKLYDAFVSYSHQDEEWVLNKLVDKLEKKEDLKLCLHFRDWTPGDWIPNQIVRSVEESRRTVIVLSKNFIDSMWSTLEFKAAHSQALKERTNRLILILIEDDLTEKDIHDDDLKLYMKMNTYLKSTDPWFWPKLMYALPHRKDNALKSERSDAFQRNIEQDKAISLDKLRKRLEQKV